jgi:hypothetical protein
MPASNTHRQAAERWSTETRGPALARLDVPADAQRERRFEVSCALIVSSKGSEAAWHSLRVMVDGVLEWERRVPTHTGGRDSLDVRFRKTVAVGRALRVTAHTEVHLAARVSLTISAEEE